MISQFLKLKMPVFLLCLVFISSSAGAVSEMVVISSHTYAGKGNPWCSKSGIAVNSAGNIIVTGNRDNGTADQDIHTIMYDDWTVIGSATYNPNNEWDGANAVAVDEEDNIIVTGKICESSTEYFYTVKYSSDLAQVLASNKYVPSGSATSRATGVVIDNDGNIFIAGSYQVGSYLQFLTVKYNSNLVYISSAVYSTSDNADLNGIAVDSQGNIFIVGTVAASAGLHYIVKYDNDLVYQTYKAYTGNHYDEGHGIAVDSQDNVITIGKTTTGGIGTFEYGFVVNKYENNLQLLDTVTYTRGGSDDYVHGPAVDKDDNIIITCCRMNALNDLDFHTVKFNDLLMVLSTATYDSSNGNADYPMAVVIDKDNNIIVTGYCYNGTDYDWTTIKYDGSVGSSPVVLETGQVKVRGGENGYIDPTKGEEAKITFKATESGQVTMKIFTLKGQLVWQDSKTMSAEGEDYIKWACKNSGGDVVSSGVYVVHVQGAGINTKKKIAIVR